ncbi:MAG: hypothetical protein QM777_21855 [Pseudorhodoferax sp.]
MTAATLWARRTVEPHWQLGDLSTAGPDRTWLVGWDAQPNDDGMPPLAGRAIARAMTDTARVSFLRAGPGPAGTVQWAVGNDGDCIRATRPAGALGTIADRLRGRPGPVTLVCSRRADAVATVFDDPAFPWWLQSQALLLSSPDAAPPDVAPEDALGLLDTDWAARAAALRGRGVLAVARPAVDGEALGLLALDGAIAERLMASLAVQARAAGLAWSCTP